MNNQIDAFLASDCQRYGKLASWLNYIVTLRAKGASYRAVCRYIALRNVIARPGEVHAYLHRCER